MNQSPMLRPLVLLAFSSLLILSPVADAQECSALISQGVYDVQSNMSDLSTATSFANWYCDQKFSSAESANEFGASLAFPFKGIPTKFGFNSNSQNFSTWNSNFCAQIRQDQSLQSRLRLHIQTINAGIIRAFNDCINADGLSVWLERTYNPRVFMFAARFTSPNSERVPYSMVETFDPGENVRCKDRPVKVARATFRTRCVRTDDSAVSIVVTADFEPRGGGTLSLPAIEKIPTVTRKTTVPLANLAKNTGDDVGDERIAIPIKNRAGDLAFGPYWAVARFGGAGKYIVEYEIFIDPSSATNPSVGRLLVDVNSQDLKQRITLAEKILSPVEWTQAGYRTITIKVDLPDRYADWLVQMRMQWDGKYLTKLRPITVTRVQ